MDIVVEMLGVEPSPTQVVPPSSSAGANMELALVNSDQTGVALTMAGDIPTFRGSSKVTSVRAVVNLDRSSSSEEVAESLKWKNSRLGQEMTIVAAGTTNKKRRLVKEFELVPSWRGTSSSLPPKKSSTNKASKGKDRESSS